MPKEKKGEHGSVVWSLMVLAMTLVFIYTIFFGIHGDEIKKHTQALANQTVVEQAGEAIDRPADELLDTGNQPTSEQLTDTGTIQEPIIEQPELPAEQLGARPQSLPGRTFYSVQELFRQAPIQEEGVVKLQGTWQREGQMKSLIATDLDQYAQYILKDMDNTHYVFLGDYQGDDLESTIIAKGGNIVAIDDKNTITQHQLRGDKVRFINLPDYKDIKVLLLVFFEEEQDVWFLQVDHETYYAKKTEFAKLFAPWYSW